MDEYQAEAIIDGVVQDSIRGTLVDCANWADGYIHTHAGCNEIQLNVIRKEAQDVSQKD